MAEYVQREAELVEAFEWMVSQLNLPVHQFLSSKHKEQEIEWTHNLIRDLDIALSTITSTLSSYWIDQIDHELERLKGEGLNDSAARDDTVSKIVRFMEMRKSLEKSYRLTLQNFEPEG